MFLAMQGQQVAWFAVPRAGSIVRARYFNHYGKLHGVHTWERCPSATGGWYRRMAGSKHVMRYYTDPSLASVWSRIGPFMLIAPTDIGNADDEANFYNITK